MILQWQHYARKRMKLMNSVNGATSNGQLNSNAIGGFNGAGGGGAGGGGEQPLTFLGEHQMNATHLQNGGINDRQQLMHKMQ